MQLLDTSDACLERPRMERLLMDDTKIEQDTIKGKRLTKQLFFVFNLSRLVPFKGLPFKGGFLYDRFMLVLLVMRTSVGLETLKENPSPTAPPHSAMVFAPSYVGLSGPASNVSLWSAVEPQSKL